MNQKIITIFVLVGLFAGLSVLAGEEVEKIVNSLKASHEKAEKALTSEQLEDINTIREGLESYKEYFESDYNENQPLFGIPDMSFHKEISAVIEKKSDLCFTDALSSEEGFERYKKEFVKYVEEPCKVINEAYSSSLAEYYRKVESTPDLSEKVKSLGPQEHDWLMNAGVCYNIMKDSEKMRDMSYGFVLCLRIIEIEVRKNDDQE